MQPLGHVEVTLVAGIVQRCISSAVGGVEKGTRAVQPLSDVQVALGAGEVKWLPTIIPLHPHARAVHHRCLRCRQIARFHGCNQPSDGHVTSGALDTTSLSQAKGEGMYKTRGI